MFSIFKKKPEQLVSPTTGELIPLADVEDAVFSQGMMGQGFGVNPSISEIYAPIAGTVTSIFPTKHAIGLKTKSGKELLIHIGIDTVELNGSGFEICVQEHQKVNEGTLLVRLDREFLKEKGKKDTVIVVFPEGNQTINLTKKAVKAQDVLLELD